jgi:Lar family restriction alleviation protein
VKDKILEDCPFCGGKTKLSQVYLDHTPGEGTWPQIECCDCDIKIGYRKTEEQAIKAWNERINK